MTRLLSRSLTRNRFFLVAGLALLAMAAFPGTSFAFLPDGKRRWKAGSPIAVFFSHSLWLLPLYVLRPRPLRERAGERGSISSG